MRQNIPVDSSPTPFTNHRINSKFASSSSKNSNKPAHHLPYSKSKSSYKTHHSRRRNKTTTDEIMMDPDRSFLDYECNPFRFSKVDLLDDVGHFGKEYPRPPFKSVVRTKKCKQVPQKDICCNKMDKMGFKQVSQNPENIKNNKKLQPTVQQILKQQLSHKVAARSHIMQWKQLLEQLLKKKHPMQDTNMIKSLLVELEQLCQFQDTVHEQIFHVMASVHRK